MLLSGFFRQNTLLVGLALLVVGPVSAEDYSDGMRAYMAGDYELAQRHWLKAAERKDSRSMFNLGLLHEQRLIRGGNADKAESWYRLAGQNGYPAADFHLAQLLIAKQGGGPIAKQLIQRSASNGYSPARRKMGQPETAVTSRTISSKQTSAAESASPSGNKARFLDQDWINGQSASRWTIQLLAFEDMMKVYDFIDAHGLQKRAAYFAERDQNGTVYKLIYGSYESKDKANSVRQLLPRSLKQHGPWLRTLGSVQNVIAGN